MIKINATKTNLNKILKWSSSRYNELKKDEVIERILNYIEEGNDVKDVYTTGSYTETGGGAGTDYLFEIKKNKIFLSIGYLGFRKFETKKKIELIVGERGKYPVPKNW